VSYRDGLVMFELVKYFSCCPEWVGSLSRLNSRLFLMLIATACGALPHNPGMMNFKITSNFTSPNQ
jgi:hypothetical protein